MYMYNVTGHPLKYTASFLLTILVCKEFLVPMFTEVLSTPTDVHIVQGFVDSSNLASVLSIVS